MARLQPNDFQTTQSGGATSGAVSLAVAAAVPGAGASDTVRFRNARTGEIFDGTANLNTTTWTIARAVEDSSRWPAAAMLNGDVLEAVPTNALVQAPEITGPLSLGTNPAASGRLRLPYNEWISGRNETNAGDVNLWRVSDNNYIEPGAKIMRDDTAAFADVAGNMDGWISLYRNAIGTLASATYENVVRLRMAVKGIIDVGTRRNGLNIQVQDHSSVVNKTITNMTRVSTTVTVTATGHTFVNGDQIAIYGVTHTFNAEVNGVWVVANALTNAFDITVPGLSSGAYTSGGMATNRPMYYGIFTSVSPAVSRGSLTGTAANADDVNCYVGWNNGPGKGTDAYYLGRNSTAFPGTAEEWDTSFTFSANAYYGIRLNGGYSRGMIDTAGGSLNSGAFALRLLNAGWMVGRNAANSADLNMLRLNASNVIELGGNLYRDSDNLFTNKNAWLTFKRVETAYTGALSDYVVNAEVQARGAGNSGTIHQAVFGIVADDRQTQATTITGATNATPIVVTTSAVHGLTTGNVVQITGVLGNTAANGYWSVTVTSTTQFSLDGSTGNGAYTSGGTWYLNQSNTWAITGATNATPIVVTTAVPHLFTTGDVVQIYGVGGNTNANGQRTITVLSTTTFSLDGIAGSGAYTSGGTVTNRSVMTALSAYVYPLAPRGGTVATGDDDMNGVVVFNAGYKMATDAYYLGHNGTIFDKAVTGAANNGSGLVRLTVPGHGLITGHKVVVANIVGTTEANNAWIVTRIDDRTFDLIGSTFANAYVSGGTVYTPEWTTQMTLASTAGYGLRFTGRYGHVAMDLYNATIPTLAYAIRFGTGQKVAGRNNADTQDVNLWRWNTGNEFQIDAPSRFDNTVNFNDTRNMVFGTTTGTKIGTGATQKLGFWNATPVVQPAASDELATVLVNTGLAATGWKQTVTLAGGTVLSPTTGTTVMVKRMTFAATVTNIRCHHKAGTSVVFNARRNQASNFLASNATSSTADQWNDGGSVQNTALAAGDDIEIMIVTVTGAVTECAITIEGTRP